MPISYGANMIDKETLIYEYVKGVNFNDPRFNVNQVKSDLTRLLHEEPGIKLQWANEKTVNEVSGKETYIERVASIKVYYTINDAEGKIAPKSVQIYGVSNNAVG